MHLKVQEAVGAKGHNVSTRLDAAHNAEACWCEGGTLGVQNEAEIDHNTFRLTKTQKPKCYYWFHC